MLTQEELTKGLPQAQIDAQIALILRYKKDAKSIRNKRYREKHNVK